MLFFYTVRCEFVFTRKWSPDPVTPGQRPWPVFTLLVPTQPGGATEQADWSRCEEVIVVKDTIREPEQRLWELGWEVERLPGLQSGLRPLMSICPFGAYCKVRGLDFYGDGFHLLESSPPVRLHLPPPPAPLAHVAFSLFQCQILFSQSFSSSCFLSSTLLSTCTRSVFIQPHQDQHDPWWYFPNANLSPNTHETLQCV